MNSTIRSTSRVLTLWLYLKMSYINDHLDNAGAAVMGFVFESLCSWIYIYAFMEFVPYV